MNKILAMLLVSILFLSLGVAINPVAGQTTTVKVDPSLIEYYQDATGQQFTVAIRIVDVTNLYGFDIKFRWNTTFLDYVSHSVRVPKDTYTDGVLWNPVLSIKDEVNATAGTYWIAYSSRWPAPTFNGTGTVFTITFEVKYHPVQPEPDANIRLELYSTELADKGAGPIPHTRQNGLVILYALSVRRDIAVTAVKPWKTVIGQGYDVKINVTVQNQGDLTETFNLSILAETVPPPSIIKTIAVSSLLRGETRTVIFIWNTTGFAKGNYTISAYAWPVQGETDTTDNLYTDGYVKVAMVGDVIPDGIIDIFDLVAVAVHFGHSPPDGHTPSDPEYTTCFNADVNGDGIIDIFDLVAVAVHFGQTDT